MGATINQRFVYSAALRALHHRNAFGLVSVRAWDVAGATMTGADSLWFGGNIKDGEPGRFSKTAAICSIAPYFSNRIIIGLGGEGAMKRTYSPVGLELDRQARSRGGMGILHARMLCQAKAQRFSLCQLGRSSLNGGS